MPAHKTIALMKHISVLHIPHSATNIPVDVRKQFLVSDAQLERELLLMTDWYTDKIFAAPHGDTATLRFPVSRLVVDPERFLDDAREPMSKQGMGAIYTRTSEGTSLRNAPTVSERRSLVERYYTPHQNALSDKVDAALHIHGRCLVIDCHSFSSRPLPHEPDQSTDRPQVCLGTDEVHTPAWLADKAIECFQDAGLEVLLNRPFAGTLVPSKHYRRNPSVSGIMIELNRGLYMNELTGAKLSTFSTLASTVQAVIGKLVHAYQIIR